MANLPACAITFLWHFHQPEYRDFSSTPVAHLPWVRLHAVRAYFDMIEILSRYPRIRANFNFVPCLLDQIEFYANGGMDKIMSICLKPLESWTTSERHYAAGFLFNCNRETMIAEYPRFAELAAKKDRTARPGGTIPVWSGQELLDLMVLFNIAWMGPEAQAAFPECAGLRAKEHGFERNDIAKVLSCHQRAAAAIRHKYSAAQKRGQIELTTTPYYHPILPLLYDTSFARRPEPQTALPNRIRGARDAEWHVREGVRRFNDFFGFSPAGMWPAEGSICPEIVPLLAANGIRWIATDESVLRRSEPAAPGHFPARVIVEGHEMTVIGRDRHLSDAIGFRYRTYQPGEAARDFVAYCRSIPRATYCPPLIAVVLDGENPWEFYPSSGKAFLEALYSTLDAQTDFEFTTMSAYLDKYHQRREVTALYSGSWIDDNFSVWIGGAEENRAWNLLAAARACLLEIEAIRGEADSAIQKAWQEIHIAEGSDWFWWYGDRFDSGMDDVFDSIFRGHIARVYELLGLPVPPTVSAPIWHPVSAAPVTQQVRLISPDMTADEESYFAWHGAATYSAKGSAQMMHQADLLFDEIHFACDLNYLYVKMRRGPHELLEGTQIEITFDGKTSAACSFDAGKPVQPLVFEVPLAGPAQAKHFAFVHTGKIVKLRLPFEALDAKPGDFVHFAVRVLRNGILLERHPAHSVLQTIVPDLDFERRSWVI